MKLCIQYLSIPNTSTTDEIVKMRLVQLGLHPKWIEESEREDSRRERDGVSEKRWFSLVRKRRPDNRLVFYR